MYLGRKLTIPSAKSTCSITLSLQQALSIEKVHKALEYIQAAIPHLQLCIRRNEWNELVFSKMPQVEFHFKIFCPNMVILWILSTDMIWMSRNYNLSKPFCDSCLNMVISFYAPQVVIDFTCVRAPDWSGIYHDLFRYNFNIENGTWYWSVLLNGSFQKSEIF